MSEIERMEALNNARNVQSNPAQFHAPQAMDNYSENNHADRLAAARKEAGSSKPRATINDVKKFAEGATPMSSISLMKQIDFIGDMPYVMALGAAIGKDLIDLVATELIILPAIFGALCSIFIFMMLLLVGGNKKKKQTNGLLKKLGVLGTGGIIDAIPGLSFIPTETIVVIFLYYTELVERKKSQQ